MNRRHSDEVSTGQRDPQARHAISRRTFLKGAAAVAAAPVIADVAGCAGTSSSALASSSASSQAELTTLMVSSDSLVALSDFTADDTNDSVVQDYEYRLALGSQVWMASDTLAVILAVGQTASPLSTIQTLNIFTGETKTLRSAAVSSDEGYEIYDVRASGKAIAWSECNMLTSAWRLYAAEMDTTGSIGHVYQLDEGDSNWDPPQFVLNGTTVFWTMMPTEGGLYTSGSSYVKKAGAGESEVQDIYVSKGRLCAAPELSDGILTITPRHETTGVYYDLIALDAETLETVSKLTLPKAVKVLNAIYQNGAFAFSVEATYDSSSAIASMGTYSDLGSGSWLRVAKTPCCTPAHCNGRLLVKNGKGTSIIDTDQRRYYQLAAPAYSWDYGDYFAVAGECERLVTFSTVDPARDTATAYVLLRVFSL